MIVFMSFIFEKILSLLRDVLFLRGITVTVSDYAAELNITDNMYNTFKQKFERKLRRNELEGGLSNYSLAYEFKVNLIKKIENEINKIPAISKEINNTNIWFLFLDFNNKEIIEMLDKRGDYLITGDIVAAKEIENQMEDLIDKFYFEMSIPWTAFVVFEEEEAWQRALSSKGNEITFWNEKLHFKDAPEPSDVIWQYNDQSSSDFYK